MIGGIREEITGFGGEVLLRDTEANCARCGWLVFTARFGGMVGRGGGGVRK